MRKRVQYILDYPNLDYINFDNPKRRASSVDTGSSLRQTLMTNCYLGLEVKTGDIANVQNVECSV